MYSDSNRVLCGISPLTTTIMASRYQTIIWDWNGTLFHDAPLCREITNEIFLQRDIPFVDAETHQRQFCHPIKTYYERIGVDFLQHNYEDIALEFVKKYEERAHALALRHGAREILESLNESGVRQIILSAAPRPYIQQTVVRQKLDHLFDVLIGQDNHYGHGKIDTALTWAAEDSFDRQTAVLIGDTDHDFEVAQKLEVDCILIPSGYQHADNLSECDATLISCLTELSDHFDLNKCSEWEG